MSRRPEWRGEVFNAVAAAIVALLIWAYANDRTRETATITGNLRLATNDPRATYVEPTGNVTVSLELRGSRRSIDTVESALRTGLTLTTGSAGVPGGVGVHTVELAEALSQDASIASTGAEIIRAQPESVRMEVGTLVTDQVPVTPVLPRAAVQGEIVVDPPIVAVTLPEAARAAVAALTLDAVVDTKNLEPGRSHSVDLELKLPDALSRWKEQVRIVPPRAKVTFTLLATTAELTLPVVPVEVAMPPAAMDQFRVSLAPGSTSIANVVVTGPLAAVDRLRRNEFQVAAVVSLTSRTLAPGQRRVPVSYWRLPEGVTVVSTAGAPAGSGAAPEITVDIAQRAGSSP